MAHAEYVPGTCNIGPAETALRIRTGWWALALTLLLFVVLAAFSLRPPWALLLFVPSSVSAVGFIQARMHFCAAFGMKGVFNLGAGVGRTETVTQAEFRRRDRRKAVLIIVYAVCAGIVVTCAGWILLRGVT